MKLPLQKIEKACSLFDSWLRPSLDFVHYQPEKRRIFATDGKLCVLAPVEAAKGEVAGPIPISVFQKVRALRGKGTLRVLRSILIRSEHGESFETIRRPKAKVPDMDSLEAKLAFATGNPDFVLDAALLIRLVEAVRTKRGPLPLAFWIDKSEKPTLTSLLIAPIETDNNAVALLSPMRYIVKAEDVLARVSIAPVKAAAPMVEPETEVQPC